MSHGMTPHEQRVRVHAIRALRDTGVAPTVEDIARDLALAIAEVSRALHGLADAHRLALRPGTDALWMVHPFSAVPTDCVVRDGDQRWFANCVWDGLAILGIIGRGTFETRSPHSGDLLRFTVEQGRVIGDAIVHFLVPPRQFWDDVGFT